MSRDSNTVRLSYTPVHVYIIVCVCVFGGKEWGRGDRMDEVNKEVK